MNTRVKKKLVQRCGYMKYRNRYKTMLNDPRQQLILAEKHLNVEAEVVR